MKLNIPPASEDLDPGDRITWSVTHQITVNGDNSWVKFEATSRRRDNETTEQAKQRLLTFVNTSVIEGCEQVAAKVEEHG